jgi:multimeric flavodoxin WrbA
MKPVFGELKECDALILGSPNWSGMTGKLKDWIDYSGDLWESGELAGKVGAAFTAGYSRSGGTEATLLQLLHLLFAHGMLVIGLPWSDRMRVSGSYYGATAHGEWQRLLLDCSAPKGQRSRGTSAPIRAALTRNYAPIERSD